MPTNDHPEPAAPPPSRHLGVGAVGAGLAVAAVTTVSLVLRPGATSTGPLVDDILAHYGQGPAAAGVLTALPCLAFGALGLVAVPLARRLGLTGTVLASGVLAAVGLLARPSASTFTVFVLLSVLALLGAALGNVLVPAWIKRHGGPSVVALMTMYSVVLAIGGAAGSALAVPLRGAGADGWMESLRAWGIVAAVPVVAWAFVLVRTGHDFPGQGPAGHLRGSVLRSPTAAAMTLMFGLQSMNAYTQFGLLPTVLGEAGMSPATAGLLIAVIAGGGIPGGLVMPTLVARSRHLPLIGLLFGALTAAGWLGFLLAPMAAPFLWAAVLSVGGFCFPMVIALIPGRSREPLVTARLSGIVQPVGYGIAATGSFTAGLILDATGTGTAMLVFMACSGVVLGIAASRAAAHRMVDDELTR